MGSLISKLEKKEAIQLCKDRTRFIKEAMEQRTRFANYHVAYINSLKRVSNALCDYVNSDEPREFISENHFSTPVNKTHSEFSSISPNKPSLQRNHMRPNRKSSIIIEETPPQTPQNSRFQPYSPCHPLASSSSSPMDYASYFAYPPPTSPQNSQWDFFGNPFLSSEYYGYENRNSIYLGEFNDDIIGLRRVREQEGIPELEEDTEHEEFDKNINVSKEEVSNNNNKDLNMSRNRDGNNVLIEDEEDDVDNDDECDHIDCTNCDSESGYDGDLSKQFEGNSVDLSNDQSVSNSESAAHILEKSKETLGNSNSVHCKPTCMVEIIKDIVAQFMIICSAGNVVSALLEASKAQYSSFSNDLSAVKMLNNSIAFFGSGSSRSSISSSRFLVHTPTRTDDNSESSSDFSDESCMFSGSHQSTLDRLYAWEIKLYNEIRSGEQVRMAYEKKCSQLRDKVAKGEDPSSVDNTRASIRNLHTRLKVSIHSVESISKRIETLRDEELQPQLLELVQGLGKMWKTMAESHQLQKRTLNEAKILLSRTPSKLSKTKNDMYVSLIDPHLLASSASNLEAELHNWKSCFESWISSQRLYVRVLTAWLTHCIGLDPDTTNLHSFPPIYGVCIEWSRLLDGVREDFVIEGLDFFAAGMGSIYAQFSGEENRRNNGIFEENLMSVEKMSEIGIKVLCAGMSVAVNSFAEFAAGSANGYANLVGQSETAKCTQDMSDAPL